MAITNTSLAAALSATSLTLTATSATGATVGGFAKVNGEFMIITGITGTQIRVGQRGTQGTAAVAHAVLSPLTFGLLADLPDLGATEIVLPVITERDIVTIGANVATLTAPVRDTHYFITKGSALATTTLPNPSAAMNGLQVTFTSVSVFAHVITCVTLSDGTTGNHTTATGAAYGGTTFTVVAFNGAWFVKDNYLYTFT